MTLSLLAAGLAAAVFAPPADANRGIPTTTTTQPNYVPPPQTGQDTQQLPGGPGPTVVPVDLPTVSDPGAGLAGGGLPLDPVSGDAPAEPTVLDQSASRPDPAGQGGLGGILSRTGAETLPLVRAGLAALTLGLGLVVLARRRRLDAASV